MIRWPWLRVRRADNASARRARREAEARLRRTERRLDALESEADRIADLHPVDFVQRVADAFKREPREMD